MSSPTCVYAVVGPPNDLSSPVDSVWTNEAEARKRAEFLDEGIPGGRWSVVSFTLDTPDQDIN